MRLKLTVAYDGTRFRGFARQPAQRTVEGALGDALRAVYPGALDRPLGGLAGEAAKPGAVVGDGELQPHVRPA